MKPLRMGLAVVALLASACEVAFAPLQTCDGDTACPAGASCVKGTCVPCPACAEGELCLAARCFSTRCGDRICPAGEGCVDGVCAEPSCVDRACPPGTVCAGGSCYAEDCAGSACAPGSACFGEACAPLACHGVVCRQGEICANGSCFPADCPADSCAEGAVCVTGECRPVTCIGLDCPAGSECADGSCVPAGCPGLSCAPGQACVAGACADPDCVGLQCPAGTRCDGGACLACASSESQCEGGADEDCDGLRDCADPDCLGRGCGAESACATPSCGADGQCQPTAKPVSTLCRAAVSACDLEERCDGTSLDCPDDQVAAAVVLCRARSGPCDAAEYCTGADPQCPPDLGQSPCTPALLSISDGPSYDFGLLALGASASHAFTVSNQGQYDAALGEVSDVGLQLAAPFQLLGGSCASAATLAPGASCTLDVQLLVQVPGPAAGALRLGYFDGAANQVVSVSLSATGPAPAELVLSDSDPHDFGLVPVGGVAAKTFSLNNKGEVPATLGTLSAAALGLSPPFGYNSSDCGASLDPGASCAIEVGFAPAAVGPYDGALQVSYGDGLGGRQVVRTLTGTGGAAAVSFLGAVGTQGWFVSGVPTGGGIADGQSFPTGVFVDSSSFMYVVDAGNGGPTSPRNPRLLKFDLTSRTFVGWVGLVKATPTGGAAGCTTALEGSLTPGWCTGGTTVQSTSTLTPDGALIAPLDVTGDETFLYVNNRGVSIQRFDKATGASAGWIGRIGDKTGIGPAACASAALHSQAPTWCTGGQAETGTADADGGLGGFSGLWADAAGDFLYATNSLQRRLQRYDISTGSSSGSFRGWLGHVGSSSPTGGDGACSSTRNAFTPGWCLGGTSELVPNPVQEGSMSRPVAVVGDGTSLFVADADENTLLKFDATSGAFEGWIGRVGDTSPTGGATGCTATANALTPGWCLGGVAVGTGTGVDGAPRYPQGLATDGASLFVSYATRYMDPAPQIIGKYDGGTGRFLGWLGKIRTAVSGSTACSAAPVGSATPGWCLGGTSEAGLGDGMFDLPGRMAVQGTTLFVADSGNFRISTFEASSGAFTGHLAHTLTPAQWAISGVAASAWAPDYALAMPRAVLVAGNYLYTADEASHRIQRFNLASGASEGWIGSVGDAPSGGAPGCSSVARRGETPGWCIGGSSSDPASAGGAGLVMGEGLWTDGAFLYATDWNNRIVRYELASGAFRGWIGCTWHSPTGGDPGCIGADNRFTPGWCVGGDTAYTDAIDGCIGVPQNGGITGDGTYLYATDDGAHKVIRYVAATGAFAGWIGRIGAQPTGTGAGNPVSCTTAGLTVTPGWCTGGAATFGTEEGAFRDAHGIAYLGGFLYVADSGNARIARFEAATGAFAGWIGRVETVPTGGAAGCTAAVWNTFTPGWCRGGSTSWTASPDIGFDSPQGLYVTGDTLYATDRNNIVLKFALAGDAVSFVGWKGKVGVTPTGGDPGCAAASPGTFTPGWCRGGRSTRAFDYAPLGAMHNPAGITGDATWIYVADVASSRILRMVK